MTVPDEDRNASRVHAAIRVGVDGITVVDPGSANGTYAVQPGASRWVSVDDSGVPLSSGSRVLIGNCVLTVRLEA
jgi:predicted component of type VI protein secretion system